MADPRPAYRFSMSDLSAWLSPQVLQRGAPYMGRISALHRESALITALVEGREGTSYAVHIQFGTTVRPLMRCSCPASYACKHVAAVMLKALSSRGREDEINPAVLKWIEDFRLGDKAGARKPAARRDALFYLLEPQSDRRGMAVAIYKGRPDAGGGPGAGVERWENIERTLLQAPAFADENDIAALRHLWMQRPKNYGWGPIALSGRGLSTLMRALLATGRLYWRAEAGWRRLHEGQARAGELVWQALDEQWTVARLRLAEGDGEVIAGDEPWYVDTDAASAGPVACGLAPDVLQRLFELPPLSPQERTAVGAVLAELAPDVPSPVHARGLTVVDVAPQPVLCLRTLEAWMIQRHKGYEYGYRRPYDIALPLFRYGEHLFAADDHAEFLSLPQGEGLKIVRRPAEEKAWLQQLAVRGLSPVPAVALHLQDEALPGGAFGLDSEAAWPVFMEQAVPALRAEGWVVDMDPDFRHLQVPVDAWLADVEDKGDGWFDLDLGIEVEGRRVALVPMLSELFARESRWLSDAGLDTIADTDSVRLLLPDQRSVRVPAERIKPLARTLIDLFDAHPGETLRLSRFDAERLRGLDDPSRWCFRGQEALLAMAGRLRDAGSVKAVPAPPGLTLILRPYQLQGLAWLQHLREQDLAGILADDMGLGKTAQTLAHLLIEKQAGRLDRPALVVLPTSLVFNWKREAALAAPDLRVLSLHGKDRAQFFGRMGEHDVVLTTYPLVWRDIEMLKTQSWHLLILDEAQTVKNAQGRAAGALRELEARHRLCLTGTPLENHLGELWSQFDFLLPGFLGDSQSFKRIWRLPIEKRGDTLRAQLLARRLRPFILRRRKEDVASELPPKTTVVRNVELSGGQRDLYETVRAAVDENVRKLVASQGLQRSHIQILDALLKLRQVCCDPRLVKLDSAARVRESAKLELLRDMVPELVSEGRRILVFSQFTHMLDLIAEQLQAQKLPYARLDGQTGDRERQVQRFQSGEVPLFLLSLRAGGVGLNLTAADTVIHYDPWWNPAAENQASDRAHRLGQDKFVFVYKLVVAGSIEERILALQERKADLAASMLEDGGDVDGKFSADEVLALLEPLP